MSSTPYILAFLTLPFLFSACATENNDHCLADSDPSTSIAGEQVTLQSAVVPRGCLPPERESVLRPWWR